MKGIKLLLVGILMLGVTNIFAQNMKHNHPQNGKMHQKPTVEERVDNLKTQLQLSDKQSAKVLTLFKETEQKRDDLRPKRGDNTNQNDKLDREKRMTEHQKINEYQDSEMKKILNNEQYAKYQELIKSRKDAIAKKHPGDKHCCKKECCKQNCCKKDSCKQSCTKANCSKQECTKQNCNKANCNKQECTKQNCTKANCSKQECTKQNCTKANCNKQECTKQNCTKANCNKQ